MPARCIQLFSLIYCFVMTTSSHGANLHDRSTEHNLDQAAIDSHYVLDNRLPGGQEYLAYLCAQVPGASSLGTIYPGSEIPPGQVWCIGEPEVQFNGADMMPPEFTPVQLFPRENDGDTPAQKASSVGCCIVL